MLAWRGSRYFSRRELLDVGVWLECQVGSYNERLKVSALGLFII